MLFIIITTYLINSWRALKTRFQNPVGAISESRPVGNRSSLLQRESTHNEPTNPIYEIRSTIVWTIYRCSKFAKKLLGV